MSKKKETLEEKLQKLGIQPGPKVEKAKTTIVLDPALLAKFKGICEKLGVSMNKVIIAYIEKFCEGDE